MTSPSLTPVPTTDPDEPVRVRLRSPGDVVAALPALLGYHARSSLVLIVLSGNPREVRLSMRLDIPPTPGGKSWRAVAAAFEPGLRAASGSEALLVQIDGDPEWADSLADVLDLTLARYDMVLADVIVTADGFYRSRRCDDPECCPPQGREVPTSSAVTAAAVATGQVIHGSRAEMAAEFAPPDGAAADKVDRVVGLFVASLPHGSISLSRDDVDALLRRASTAATNAGEIALDDAIRLALMLGDGDVRDQTYLHLVRAGEDAHRALWASVCRRLPRSYCAAPLAFFALAAYLQGAGAVANVALAEANDVDWMHPTVRLIDDVVAAGISPRSLRATLAHAMARAD